MQYKIGFNRSSLLGDELSYISRAISSGEIAGDQTFSKKCQALLESDLGVDKALLTSSCTHALEMAALLLGIEEGDEVIVPSFTFVSTANAFVMHGARPVFCDVRPDTLNIDETKIADLITSRTRAIVPVHYAGVACDMDVIGDIAREHGLAVVEDNAHGLFGKYKGRWLGTFGAFATQSFHETKNITCGEGGALLVNDRQYVERAEIIREKGTNRSRFFRGEVDKYSWVDMGSSYVMSDVLAAFLFGQLENWREIQDRRRVLWERHDESLRVWADEQGVQRPTVPDDCEHACHLYYLLMPSPAARKAFIEHCKGHGVHVVFHYLPLHASEFAKRLDLGEADCPVTERVSECIVRLPLYVSMSDSEQELVIEAVRSFEL